MMFFVHDLPPRVLSPNGGTRDEKRRAEQVKEAMLDFGSNVYHALQETHEQPFPHFDLAVLTLEMHVCHGARGKCPRCTGRCQCYRPRKPSNFSGDIATAVVDALARHDVIDSGTFDHVDEVRLRIMSVQAIADEGVLISIDEV